LKRHGSVHRKGIGKETASEDGESTIISVSVRSECDGESEMEI